MSTAVSPQAVLLASARTLADELASQRPPVKSSTLRSLVADFISAPVPDKARLERLLKMVADGKGGHLQRTDNFADQALRAIEVLQRFLETSEHTPEELRTVLAWAGRLLLIDRRAAKKPKQDGKGGSRKPNGPKPRSRHDSEPTISEPKQVGTLRAVKGSSLAALQQMKAQLKKKEED